MLNAAGELPLDVEKFLRTRMAWAESWQLAGSVGRHAAAGFWFAAVPEERWPADPQWREGVRKLWQGEYGDRRQEVVFIGIGIEEKRLRAALDACLPTDAEWQAVHAPGRVCLIRSRGGPRRCDHPCGAERQGALE